MKTWVAIVLFVVAGIVVGVGGALYKVGILSGGSIEVTTTSRSIATPSESDRHPVFKADSELFSFGKMEASGRSSHPFVISNEGDATLVLKEGGVSCGKCTFMTIKNAEIPPGGKGEVLVEWEALPETVNFRQSATIFTNDPKKRTVTLTIEGAIIDELQISPNELAFTNLSINEAKSAELRIHTFNRQPLEIRGYRLTKESLAPLTDVTWKPMTAEELPEHATNGFIITVALKSGLPFGPLSQKILLQTNSVNSSEIAIPVVGSVGSDISVMGVGYDVTRSLLRLGSVGQAGKKISMTIFVRGPHRKETVFQQPQTTPDVLRVTVGEVAEVAGTSVVKVPLQIEIPAGSPPVSCMGSNGEKLGEIRIGTSHPQVPELRIQVQFAVEG